MTAIETLKQFEQMAFQEYEEKLDNTQIEKPSDEELFSDNKATAAMATKVIEHDEETKRVLEAQKNNAYTVKTSSAKDKKSEPEVKTAEVKGSSWGSSGYGNGYSYGTGYGYYSSSKPATEEEKAKKAREEMQAEINKLFKECCEDAFSADASDIKNIFEIEESATHKRAVREAQAMNGGEYTKEQKKMKRKLNLMVFGLRVYSVMVVSLKNAIKNVK